MSGYLSRPLLFTACFGREPCQVGKVWSKELMLLTFLINHLKKTCLSLLSCCIIELTNDLHLNASGWCFNGCDDY